MMAWGGDRWMDMEPWGGGQTEGHWEHDGVGRGRTEGHDGTREGQRDVGVRMQWGEEGTDRDSGHDAMGQDRRMDTMAGGGGTDGHDGMGRGDRQSHTMTQ